jgi:hypothetical protein
MTDKIMHCWPTSWLEAAHHAGFAYYGKGKSLLINDKMRNMLEKFALSIQEQEREACAEIADEFEDRRDYGAGDAIRARTNSAST